MAQIYLPFTKRVARRLFKETGKTHPHAFFNPAIGEYIFDLPIGTPIIASASGIVDQVISSCEPVMDREAAHETDLLTIVENLPDGRFCQYTYGHILINRNISSYMDIQRGHRLGTLITSFPAGVRPHLHFSYEVFANTRQTTPGLKQEISFFGYE